MTEEERQERTERQEVVDELDKLRDQLGVTIDAMRKSPQAQKLQQDIVAGLNQIGQGLEKTAKQIRESEQTKKLGDQVKRTMETARESNLGHDVERALVGGLRQLNEELESAIKSMEEKQKEAESAEETDAPTG